MIEFDEFRITDKYLLEESKPKKAKMIQGMFLKGPISWEWLCVASKLSNKALHVAVALWFISGLAKTNKIKMQKKVLKDLGVSRHAFYRAINEMEKARLISADRKVGQTYFVTLMTYNNDVPSNRDKMIESNTLT